MLASFLYVITLICALAIALSNIERNDRILYFPALFLSVFALYSLVTLITQRVGIGYSLPLATIVNVLVAGFGAWAKPAQTVLQEKPHHEPDGQEAKQAVITHVTVNAFVLVVVVLVAIWQFGLSLDNNYVNNDAANHVHAAKNIAYSTGILEGQGFLALMNATWMMVLSPWVDAFYCYKVAIVVECGVLALTGMAFYSAIWFTCKQRLSRSLYVMITLLFLCGYPWLVVLEGFGYLGTGVAFICVILFLFAVPVHSKARRFANRVLLSLAFIGLVTSYLLFSPALFLAGFIALIIDGIRRKSSTIDILLDLALVFCLPVILGYFDVFCYYFDSSSLASSTSSVSALISEEGGIFKNLYSGFIFIAPIMLYSLYVAFSSKDLAFASVGFTIVFLYSFLLLVLCVLDYVSSYYFYKMHFALWVFSFALTAHGLSILKQKSPLFMKSYITVYALLFCLACSNVDAKLSTLKPSISPSAISDQLFQVYKANITYATIAKYDQNKMELYKEAANIERSSSSPDAEVLCVAHYFDKDWYRCCIEKEVTPVNTPGEDPVLWIGDDEQIKAVMLQYDYVMLINWTTQLPMPSGTEYRDFAHNVLKDYEIVCSNSAGEIYRSCNAVD